RPLHRAKAGRSCPCRDKALWYYARMMRTTITLPDDLAAVVAREAQRRRTSLSQVVREALIAHLAVGGEEHRKLPFARLGRSGQRHTARDIETILEKEWAGARRR